MSPALFALEEHKPLAPFTTIGVGGPARWYAAVDSVQALVEAARWARARRAPLLALGGGSNLLPADAGFMGLAIHIKLGGVEVVREDADHVWLRAAAGEDWDGLVARTVAEGWAGLECLSGIPGCVGAAPIQNIGAYGQELSETLVEVEAIDLTTLQRRSMDRQACRFGYRHSVFKAEAKGRFLITAIVLKLRKDGRPTIGYADLERRLGPDASLGQTREAVLATRREKSMVIDPRDPNSRSCGSFFMNPVLTPAEYAAFSARLPGPHPRYAADGGRVKLAAAWLIEQAGFAKGLVYGAVGLSQRHCLAIINRGGGSSAEIIELARRIRDGVEARFGVRLQPEPEILGEDGLPARL